jgi:hypothetical protein
MSRTSGSVGTRGGQPPWVTRPLVPTSSPSARPGRVRAAVANPKPAWQSLPAWWGESSARYCGATCGGMVFAHAPSG